MYLCARKSRWEFDTNFIGTRSDTHFIGIVGLDTECTGADVGFDTECIGTGLFFDTECIGTVCGILIPNV